MKMMQLLEDKAPKIVEVESCGPDMITVYRSGFELNIQHPQIHFEKDRMIVCGFAQQSCRDKSPSLPKFTRTTVVLQS